MVGTGRFELPTPRTPSECSTRLSHVPIFGSRVFERGGLILHQPPDPVWCESEIMGLRTALGLGRANAVKASALIHLDSDPACFRFPLRFSSTSAN